MFLKYPYLCQEVITYDLDNKIKIAFQNDKTDGLEEKYNDSSEKPTDKKYIWKLKTLLFTVDFDILRIVFVSVI